MITVTIDGKVTQTGKPKFIIELTRENGIGIPSLCCDKSLNVVGACRLCLVEIEGSKKLITACSTLARDNMVVRTKTDKLIKHKQRVLRMLLGSHLDDCLAHQRSGECQLQRYPYEYGVKFREHDGTRGGRLVNDSSPYIIRGNSKRILRGKCARACNVMDDREILGFLNRGCETRINLDINDTFESSYCISYDRCVVVCPVGVLMDKRTVNLGREWESGTEKVQYKVCEHGCEFEVLRKGGKNIALRALGLENDRPFCLKGRLTTELLNIDNPKQSYKKVGGKFVEADWDSVLSLDKILKKVEKINNK